MEGRIVVDDPQGYQRELLALLGSRDPADVLEATSLAVREHTNVLCDDLRDKRPRQGEWSVAQLLGHLWDAEIAFSFRARLILAQDTPRLVGYDQSAWANLARPPFAELDALTALRTANLALIRETPETLWNGFGHRDERVPPALFS